MNLTLISLLYCRHYCLLPHVEVRLEVVYVTIGGPAFCLALSLTAVHLRGELQRVGYVVSKKSSVCQSSSRNSWYQIVVSLVACLLSKWYKGIEGGGVCKSEKAVFERPEFISSDRKSFRIIKLFK